jgi:hypothetical protein
MLPSRDSITKGHEFHDGVRKMKPLNIFFALVITASASFPVYAGRDQAQILTQQQQERTLAEKQAQRQLGKGGSGAAGPSGIAAKEGEPGKQSLLLKRFHPKNAYGY